MSQDDVETCDAERSAELKTQGFEAGELVYAVMPEFTREDLKDALFESTFRNPRTILLDPVNVNGSVKMVITLVKPIYAQYPDVPNYQPHAYYNHPDWYLEGWVLEADLSSYDEGMRVRAVIYTVDGQLDGARIQRIPASPDPDGLIRTVE